MGARAEGQSLKATGLEIVERLNARWDVRLDLIIQNEALSLEQRRQMLIARMLERALADIDEQSLNMDVEPAVLAAENQALIERAVRGDAPEVEVNFAITEHNFKILRDYTGGQVTDYITRLCKRFEAMSRAKTPGELALEIFGGGLVCVGTAMGKLTFAAWRAGQPLLTAIRAGVTGIGMKTAVAVVIIVLAALLLYLFLENPKKILGLIVNDTDDDLVVKDWRKGVDGGAGGDLWMEHGHMANFPEDHASGDLNSPLVQVRKRVWSGPGDEENAVYAGFYFGDRNFGLRGVEGVMLFTSTTSNLKYAHMFAVPYVNDNGTNMRCFNGAAPDLPGLFRDLYNGRKTTPTSPSTGRVWSLRSTILAAASSR